MFNQLFILLSIKKHFRMSLKVILFLLSFSYSSKIFSADCYWEELCNRTGSQYEYRHFAHLYYKQSSINIFPYIIGITILDNINPINCIVKKETSNLCFSPIITQIINYSNISSPNIKILRSFSIDSDKDQKPDKLLIFKTGYSGMGSNPPSFVSNNLNIVELVADNSQMGVKAKITGISFTAPLIISSIIQIGDTLYILGGASGKTLYKTSVANFLSGISPTILQNDIGFQSKSELIHWNGKLSVLSSGRIMSYMNGVWIFSSSTLNNINPSISYRAYKYRHLQEIVLYQESSPEIVLLEEYSANTSLIENRYGNSTSSFNVPHNIFNINYKYYMSYDGSGSVQKIDKLDLYEPRYNLKSGNQFFSYEEDEIYYANPTLLNLIKIKVQPTTITSSCGMNSNFNIDLVKINDCNSIWGNTTAIPIFVNNNHWLTDTERESIKSSTGLSLSSFLETRGINRLVPGCYKMTIATSIPWISRPSIIKIQ